MPTPSGPLADILGRYLPGNQAEAADVERVRALAESADDPWLRSIPLHVTASALIVHPDTGRVLLRWHRRQQAWLQVGGHPAPGEAREITSEANLHETVSRAERLLAGASPDHQGSHPTPRGGRP